MYKSPIEVTISEMRIVQDNEIFKAVHDIGIKVDKAELKNALIYDRKQYRKGYRDATVYAREMLDMLYVDAVDDYDRAWNDCLNRVKERVLNIPFMKEDEQ